jgi:rhomboid family GlyGly-CTERM serine protease
VNVAAAPSPPRVRGRGEWVVVGALAAAALAATAPPGEWLELRRNHELWRVITCHFTHWSYEQLAWDALAFTSLAFACARRNRRAFHATLLASALLVPLAVLAFAPHITAYRGLSGLASAMFALLLALEWRRLTWPVMLLATGFAAKLAFETVTGGAVFVSDMGGDVVSVPVAHLAGALIGAIGGLSMKRLALLAPLLLTACVSIPLPIPQLDDAACNVAKDLLGNWRSQRITQLGPASVALELRDDCRFVMRIGLPFSDIEEQGRYAVEGDRIRFTRKNNRETVWPIRRDGKGRLLAQEAPSEWHAYTHDPCASFWPCSSR